MRTATDWARKQLRRFNSTLARRVGVKLAVADAGDLADAETRARIDRARATTMTSDARLFALDRAVEYVTRSGLAGAVVECGVWRGGSMRLAAEALLARGDAGRELYLYDTYEGMTAPSQADLDPRGRSARKLVDGSAQDSQIMARAPLDQVRHTLAQSAYPAERIHYVVGRVEDTIPGTIPDAIALLRLDTDWYESTVHELVHLFPRLVPGGVLIIDDYGYWQGCRKAVDEYFRDSPILLTFVDDTGVVGVKR